MGWILEEHQRLPAFLSQWTLGYLSIQKTLHRCPTKKTHLNLLRVDPTNHNRQNSLRGHKYRTLSTTISKYRTWFTPFFEPFVSTDTACQRFTIWASDGIVYFFAEDYHQQFLTGGLPIKTDLSILHDIPIL